jgi:hypothetical protein
MPLSDTHRRKRGKNYFALAVLVAFVAALFYLTMLKVRGV